LHRARGSDGQEQERGAASGRGPQPARPGPAWRPGTRPPVTRRPFGGHRGSNSRSIGLPCVGTIGNRSRIFRVTNHLIRAVSFRDDLDSLVVGSSVRTFAVLVLLAATASCQGEFDPSTDAWSYCMGNPMCYGADTRSAGNAVCINENFWCVAGLDSTCGTLVWSGLACREGEKCIEGSCRPSCDDVCPTGPDFGNYCSGTHVVHCLGFGSCYGSIERDCPDGQTCSTSTKECQAP
jgi:hypothetical protein